MVLKHFIFFLKSILKQTCFFPLWPPLTHPITHPRECRDGDTKRGDVGLIKVKKQVDFKIHSGWFKAFLDHVVFFSFSIKGAGWLGPDP